MWIFAMFLCKGASVNRGVVESGHFSMPLGAIFSEPLRIRPKLSYMLMTEVFSMDHGLCQCIFLRIVSGIL